MKEDIHEYTAIVPKYYGDDKPMTIGVDKIGGGTLGSEYTGTWEVTLYSDGTRIRHDAITTGTPKDHDQAARIAAAFWADDIDEVDDMPMYDRLSCFEAGI